MEDKKIIENLISLNKICLIKKHEKEDYSVFDNCDICPNLSKCRNFCPKLITPTEMLNIINKIEGDK